MTVDQAPFLAGGWQSLVLLLVQMGWDGSMAVIGPPAGAIGLGWEPASWGFEGSCGPFLLTRDGLS